MWSDETKIWTVRSKISPLQFCRTQPVDQPWHRTPHSSACAALVEVVHAPMARKQLRSLGWTFAWQRQGHKFRDEHQCQQNTFQVRAPSIRRRYPIRRLPNTSSKACRSERWLERRTTNSEPFPRYSVLGKIDTEKLASLQTQLEHGIEEFAFDLQPSYGRNVAAATTNHAQKQNRPCVP